MIINQKKFISKVIYSIIRCLTPKNVRLMTDVKKDYQRILSSVQKAVKGEAGKTGTWSSKKPIIDLEKCIPAKSGKPSCFNCWLYCPEAVVSRTIPPQIDLEYCKGCGICVEECPVKAIKMEEVETQ